MIHSKAKLNLDIRENPMPWFGYALLSMFFASLYALVQKQAMNHKIGVLRWLAYTFIFTFIAFAVYTFTFRHEFPSLIEKLSVFVKYQLVFLDLHLNIVLPINLLLAVIAGGFTSVGNFFYVRAVEKSPNPAYPEGINLFATPLTLIVSVLFLSSGINWMKTGGIMIIILGLFLLTFERGIIQPAGRNWKSSSFTAMACFGLLFVVVKALLNAGFSPEQTLTTLFFFAGLGFWIGCSLRGISLNLKGFPNVLLVTLIFGSLLSFMDNLMQFISIKLIPNPAYPTAIYNSSTILVLFISPLVFPKEAGGEFNLKRWLGVIITVAGVVVVALG